MSEELLEIDISKTKSDEDLIKIRLGNDEVVQLNFSKLFQQSKTIQSKYKYFEGISMIQQEIQDIEENKQIHPESIKQFIQLFTEEKVKFGNETYKDIYTLSEYFCTAKITNELDKIGSEKLFKDLNFTIQFLLDYEQLNNSNKSKLLIKIENFLRTRINECLLNDKFKKLPNSAIYRIFNESQEKEEKIDDKLLLDFILEKASTRFIMFKFVEIDKLSNDKVRELIEFLDSQEEKERKMYLEHIPFNISFVKNITNKYEEILKENKELKEILKETKNKCEEKDQEINKILKETKKKQEEKDEESKEKLKLKEEEEVEESKREKNQSQDEIKVRKSANKQYTESIIVGGLDNYNQLGENPNNKAKNGDLIISPSLKLSLDPSSLLSFSTYCYHSVVVMSDGSLKGIGSNRGGRISSTLQKTAIKNFTDFCIKDKNGHQLSAVSAVCYYYGTLYMFSKSSGNGRQLVLCDIQINDGDPVFLDIGDHYPVSLFGGHSHTAAICREGEIIFINRDSVIKSPNSRIESISLPDGEKASSIAYGDYKVFVLSSNGRVFKSSYIKSNEALNFSIDSKLSDQEIVCLSGTHEHCLAISKDGLAFGVGLSEYGEIGFGEEVRKVGQFKEISSLFGYKIRAAYAGYRHSLFETSEGKILSCGWNNHDQLLFSSGINRNENVYLPTETSITSGAAFCIAGDHVSAVFIGSGPPRNTPNTRVDEYE